MARSGALRKQKKTYSLSKDSVGYLEKITREGRRNSISEVLDELIQEKKLAAEQQRISANIRNYYDSISNEEQQENRVWGQFAESQSSTE